MHRPVCAAVLLAAIACEPDAPASDTAALQAPVTSTASEEPRVLALTPTGTPGEWQVHAPDLPAATPASAGLRLALPGALTDGAAGDTLRGAFRSAPPFDAVMAAVGTILDPFVDPDGSGGMTLDTPRSELPFTAVRRADATAARFRADVTLADGGRLVLTLVPTARRLQLEPSDSGARAAVVRAFGALAAAAQPGP